jgi:hypothetical protein
MHPRVYYSTILRGGRRGAPSFDESQRDLRDALRRAVPTVLPR